MVNRRTNPKPLLFLVILSGVIIIASGCTKETKMPINGLVKYRATTIMKGTIIFVPTAAELPQAVGSIVDGAYQIGGKDGVAPGTYSVRIVGYRGTGKMANTGPLGGNESKEILEPFIPKKYNSETELKVTIEPEKTEYNFELD